MKRALWIKGYEGQYKILPNGKVYSFIQNKKDGKLLTPRKSGSGYLMVTLLGEQIYIHQLVAEHYLINPHKRKFKIVAFKDGNVENLLVSNLIWTDADGRAKLYSKNNKKVLKSEGMISKKISEENLINIARLMKDNTITDKQNKIAQLYGIHRITLYRLRKTKKFKTVLSKV